MGLLAQLFGKRDPAGGGTIRRLPPGKRVYAVGDIHGRRDLLADLYERILAHHHAQPEAESTVVFLGDYVDRGLDSRGVIDFLLTELSSELTHAFLMGNHEDLLLSFLERPEETVGLWLDNGGLATLLSYGVGRPTHSLGEAELRQLAEALNQALPTAHHQFLHNLALTHRLGDYVFVHAGLRPGRPLEAQSPHDLLWIRDAFLAHEEDLGLTVVHGHSTAEAPQLGPGRIGVDTGAYATGRLTAAVLEADRLEFLATGDGPSAR